MIFIALGANLPGPAGSPRQTLAASLTALEEAGAKVRACSPWYASTPVPASDQPDYLNGVARVETSLDPGALLALLHAIEARFGRARTVPNAARSLDLDLLDYNGLVLDQGAPVLPHPRLHERAFVLYPLRDIAVSWRHPVSGLDLDALMATLDPAQIVRRLPGDPWSSESRKITD
ncbi:2-amino-4-hydroxy-6-hydroxymethyldihydropteridine diphosphokinase [Pararhodospirillum oryzae]|uniref:2-amino-4-hydroxy-6-hydroxymethyldihydropteridine pyrophosphokinase n=1 Tax=Pararhodospirillum oryzae TaxID=478448 RepID=A0A512H6R2_9PROT|nr:2-amino-4-hydroxy-6-hydroxymethyldihydropteridine diphosphokinase [Pararhodospirillum oryzae]GEO81137.1 7,8-dihydro-6-hydroxymethylpterin-pyrophosphokina se [Pararhodospirillum oryzae]